MYTGGNWWDEDLTDPANVFRKYSLKIILIFSSLTYPLPIRRAHRKSTCKMRIVKVVNILTGRKNLLFPVNCIIPEPHDFILKINPTKHVRNN